MQNNFAQPILVVEDSPSDYYAMSTSFTKVGLHNALVWCQDGDEALDYLFRRGKFVEEAKSPRPGIVLLDLNLPGTDGREVLQEIKNDESLRRIPIVVLTTSSNERDINECYKVGANSYIVKPVDSDGLLKALQRLKDYWFEIVILPRGD